MKAKTIDELQETVRDAFNKIDEPKIYFTLKTMRVKYVLPETVAYIKLLLAISEVIPFFTVEIVEYFCKTLLKKNVTNIGIRQVLHTLGDKHILTLLREEGRLNRYVFNPLFMNNFQAKAHDSATSV